MLLITNVIPGILLFAFVASLIGEDVLEGEGGLSWLGAATVYLPMAFGLFLILFGRPLSRSPLALDRIWVPLALLAFGIVGTAVGVLGIGGTTGDANIGAGLLLLFCPFLAALAIAWAVMLRRQPPGAPSGISNKGSLL